MIRYVGLDVHKRFLAVCILDGQGKVLFRGRADCDRDALARFARQRLKKSDGIALEATTNTWPIVEILRPFVAAASSVIRSRRRRSPRRRSRRIKSTPRCSRSCCVATTCRPSGNLTERLRSCAPW